MIRLSAPTQPIDTAITIKGSKSISNRILVLETIFKSHAVLQNLSDAEDTVLLKQALNQIKNSTSGIIDINHAGTDMRFLTALLCVTEGTWTLTGSERIQQRPVGELVEALRSLGAEVNYLENKNFPPLQITGKKIAGGTTEIDAGVSSQFISALLLIAPTFEKGLTLRLKNEIVSKPYIDMTIALLKDYGVQVSESKNSISISSSSDLQRGKVSIHIESDWSSASYWYAVCALSRQCDIELSNFNTLALQADAILPALYEPLGVHTVFKNGSIFLSKKSVSASVFRYDFTNCPDIAQTLAVTCVGLGLEAELTGLRTLKIKETDRIVALKTELEKTSVSVSITDNSIHISPRNPDGKHLPLTFATHHDHRMAMSFAPLSIIYPSIHIENPGVVAKSYPRFWEDLKYAGFNVDLQP